MKTYGFSISFVGDSGYDETFTVESDNSDDLAEARESTIATLKELGAKPRPQRVDPRPAGNPARTMEQAAADTGLAKKACAEHGDTMRLVPAGVSQRTGRSYNAFWGCSVNGCKSR